MKCNETLSKWCENKHGASKIIDTFETYHLSLYAFLFSRTHVSPNQEHSLDRLGLELKVLHVAAHHQW
jgi:hypothetical protein